jgi:hypothetical protein
MFSSCRFASNAIGRLQRFTEQLLRSVCVSLAAAVNGQQIEQIGNEKRQLFYICSKCSNSQKILLKAPLV